MASRVDGGPVRSVPIPSPADPLAALFASDAEQAQGGGTRGCGGIPREIVAAGAHLVEGKVWSAKVSARKPE
ncbi:hypothetical protein L6R50_14620 [Myxococcota bacterium]|nr:hypothetical protein [Myxococcota bacterium]